MVVNILVSLFSNTLGYFSAIYELMSTSCVGVHAAIAPISSLISFNIALSEKAFGYFQ